MEADSSGLGPALKYLDRFQFHGFRLGLERMDAILSALDNPHTAYPCIHVAGTNGKGSTCAVINSILTSACYRAGFYSSPHLFRLNERFRIGTSQIDDKTLALLLNRIRSFIEAGYELSYFEYTTAVAMLWFREIGVDVAIFETGLGGRLDATNVVMPEVSVITNIALEHQTYLGDTLQKIAFEKAGIIKPGRPVVCSVKQGAALEVIEARAKELDAPFYLAGRDYSFEVNQDGTMTWQGLGSDEITGITPGLPGRHQASNTALAIAAVKVLDRFNVEKSHIVDGCANATWPGRGEIFQYRGRRLLLDGAHNPHGIEALKAMLADLAQETESEVLLWACSDEGGDKDFVKMLGEIAPAFKKIIITEPPGPRKPVTVQMWRKSPGMDSLMHAWFVKEWQDAFEKAMEACSENGLVCVAGSLYLVGSVRAVVSP